MTKLEEVARAIEAALDTDHQWPAKERATIAARAAIEALREPNEAMIETWPHHHCAMGATVMPENADANWRYMIDAILNEKP